MKKIIISGVALLLVVAGFSQQSSTSPNSSDAANLERIRQNQVKNKAAEDALKQQQDALKQQAANKQQPQVPEQFKLSPSGTWTNKPVAEKPVINQEPSSKQSSPGIIGVTDVQTLKNGEAYKQNPGVTEQKNNEPVAIKQETKPIKEILPAVLKGTSMDPDAKPIVPAAKTPDVKVPAQNSGNTQPAVEQKQVSKENNSVPSSTVPVKKQD